jgi:hypothetical protein
MYQAGMIELWTRPTVFLSAGNDTPPNASSTARAAATAGIPVVNLRHEELTPDPVISNVLPLIDGTRSVDQLGEAISSLVSTGRLDAASLSATGDWSGGRVGSTPAVLKTFAELSLLIR